MKKLLLIFSLVILAGCSVAPQQEEIVGEVNTLYNDGLDALQRKDYARALNLFEELERQHPYSGWATRAQMMVIYTHFRLKNYDEISPLVDRFLALHPGYKDADYVLYLKALSFYNQISDVSRDQGHTRDAKQTFEELVTRYPESKYAEDAQAKITLCLDHLAGQEMMVGRFYLNEKRYLAAINRFQTVLKKYETSTHTPEALYRLVESYTALGIADEAYRVAAILGHNFPESKWYQDSYKIIKNPQSLAKPGKEKSWVGQIGKGIKDLF